VHENLPVVKLSRSVSSHPGELSLAIPPAVDAVRPAKAGNKQAQYTKF